MLAWFQPQRPEHFQQDNFPVFNLITEEGRFYGFPVHGVPGFKIGRYHHFEESGPASEIDFEVYPEDEAMLRDVTSRYFPDARRPDHDAEGVHVRELARTATSCSTCTRATRRSATPRPARATASSSRA